MSIHESGTMIPNSCMASRNRISMKKYKRDEIAKVIFEILLTAGFVTIALTAPNAVQLFTRFHPKNARERERVKQSLSTLKKRGFITEKDNLDGYFALTKEGKARAMRYKIENTKIQKQKKWDKKWRLVMFDVPEEKKKARQAINFALKKIGCVHYQKSVFITPFPCEQEIDFVGGCFGVRDYLRIVVAESVERDKSFIKKFGL